MAFNELNIFQCIRTNSLLKFCKDCKGRTVTHPLISRRLVSWLSAFPRMPKTEHRRLVPSLATPCSVLCSTSPWYSGKSVRSGASWVLPRPCKLPFLPGARCADELQGTYPEHKNTPSEKKPEMIHIQLWRYKTIVVIKRQQQTAISKKKFFVHRVRARLPLSCLVKLR